VHGCSKQIGANIKLFRKHSEYRERSRNTYFAPNIDHFPFNRFLYTNDSLPNLTMCEQREFRFTCPKRHRKLDLRTIKFYQGFRSTGICDRETEVDCKLAVGKSIVCNEGGWLVCLDDTRYHGVRSVQLRPDPNIETDVQSGGYPNGPPGNPLATSSIPSVSGGHDQDLPASTYSSMEENDITTGRLSAFGTPSSGTRSVDGEPPHVEPVANYDKKIERARKRLEKMKTQSGNSSRASSSSSSSSSSSTGSPAYPYYGDAFAEPSDGWTMTKRHVKTATLDEVDEAFVKDFFASYTEAGWGEEAIKTKFQLRIVVEKKLQARERK
jgi:hypothetical protein